MRKNADDVMKTDQNDHYQAEDISGIKFNSFKIIFNELNQFHFF